MNENIPIPTTPRRWIDVEPIESTDKPATIKDLDTQVRIRGLYAHIKQTITIENPNDRPLSVGITITLPDRASVCGYALEIEDQMIEGVVVPKEKARVAFETEQRRGADPGLVEAVKGNVYQTRVYPVPAKGCRKIALEVSAPLLVVSGTSAFLDIPMPAETLAHRSLHISCELPGVDKIEISGANTPALQEDGVCWAATLEEENVENTESLRIALPKLPDAFSIVEHDEEGQAWFVASEKAPAPKPVDEKISSVCILWDVSGSRSGVDHAAEIALAEKYCDGVKDITLVPFGFKAYKSSSFENKEDLIKAIEALDYDGGSDFALLADFLGTETANSKDAYILFSDALDTLSDKPLAFDRALNLIAIISGTARDFEAARQACSGRAFDVAAAPQTQQDLSQVLFGTNTLTGVDGSNVSNIAGIGSGADGRFTAIGKLDAASADIVFSPTNTSFHLDVENAKNGKSLSRAWAVLRVAALSARAADNADELLSLGRSYGVVSSETSLLVLEDLDQWIRYDIEPPVSWTSMHEAWEKVAPGLMSVSNTQAEKDRHIAALKSQWAQVKAWWEKEHATTAPADPGRCFNCGNTIDANLPFCPHCGTPIAAPPVETTATARRAGILGRAQATLDGVFSNVRHARMAPRDVEANGMPAPAAAGMAAPEAMYRATPMVEDIDMCAMEFSAEMVDDGEALSDSTPSAAAPKKSIEIQPWSADADYIDALDAAAKENKSARKVYLALRKDHALSPAFFLDCASWFTAHDDVAFAIQVLSNLAEMRIEDAALLRVMGWRLREAGDLKRSLVVLRRVLNLRHEDSQSHRDVALTLDELARSTYADGNEEEARSFVEEAGSLYREIVETPWTRRPMAIGLFAVEEYNVLRAWATSVKWKTEPELPSLGEDLEGVLESDIRITLAWDADETDVDIHVTEPGGEEAYYGNRFTYIGGRVSEDITDGYGPELYEIRRAIDGVYIVRAHYFASHQQAVFGPANCTLTVFTDWGRPTQSKQVTSTRLENAKEMVDVGRVVWGDVQEQAPEEEKPAAADLAKGCTAPELIAVLGQPAEGDPDQTDGVLRFAGEGERAFVATLENGKCTRLVETTPWGDETVLFQ